MSTALPTELGYQSRHSPTYQLNIMIVHLVLTHIQPRKMAMKPGTFLPREPESPSHNRMYKIWNRAISALVLGVYERTKKAQVVRPLQIVGHKQTCMFCDLCDLCGVSLCAAILRLLY